MSCDNSLSASESKKLAKKLRHDDPEQFQTLVRMHLSFVLDLHTEETDGPPEKTRNRPIKWSFVPFSKKIRGPIKEISESVPLTKEVINQIYILIDFLSKEENVSQEGIFRRSGKVTRQQELKLLVNQGTKLNLDEGMFSVHDVASVLKSFLADLPEPVLTEAYYPAYCQIAELCQREVGSKARILRSLQLLLLLLPYENRRLLKNILRLLHLTSNHVATNRMSSQNLSTLFTPHLICPRKLSPEAFHTTAQSLSCIVAFMITEGITLFEVPKELATDIKAYWDRRRLTPNHFLERSINESTAANTVFSFVDRERTAQENVVNPTETALAQLYAHIQSLPESHKKKRLIKQFNKENGQGTPRTKSIGDSIKKHIFCKNVKVKSIQEMIQLKSGLNYSDCALKTPDQKIITTTYRRKVNTNKNGVNDRRRRDSTSSDDEDDVEDLLDEEEEEVEEEHEVEIVENPIDVQEHPTGTYLQGSDDNSTESEASCSFVWIKPLPVRKYVSNLDSERYVLGEQPDDNWRQQQEANGRGRRNRSPRRKFDLTIQRLSIQPECINSQPSRSEFFQPNWRLRPNIEHNNNNDNNIKQYKQFLHKRYRRYCWQQSTTTTNCPAFPIVNVFPRRRQSPFDAEFWIRLSTDTSTTTTTSTEEKN